jgi:hypothetical protein
VHQFSRHGSAERLWFQSITAGRKIRGQHGECRRDDEIVMAAGRLQSEPAAHARLEDKLTQLAPQKFVAWSLLGDSQASTPHGGAKALDQPLLTDDEPVASGRASGQPIGADQTHTHMRRLARQQLDADVAKPTLIKGKKVETGKVWSDERELFAQGSLRQAQRCADCEAVWLDVEEHERAVVTAAGEIETGNANERTIEFEGYPWQAVFASGAFGVAAQCPLHRLLAPKFADNEDQVLSMSMPKLCDDARGLSRADPSGKDCVQSGLRFLTPHKSPIRERLG